MHNYCNNNNINIEEEELWQNAAAEDALKFLGPISEDEYNYYANL